jgi:3-methyladenine DNA glycosylase Mpg
MLKIYYRIWVSLFLNIKTAQNGNQNAALILSFLVLTAINIMNTLLVSMLLILIFEIIKIK